MAPSPGVRSRSYRAIREKLFPQVQYHEDPFEALRGRTCGIGMHRVGYFPDLGLGSRRQADGSQASDRRAQYLLAGRHAGIGIRVLFFRQRSLAVRPYPYKRLILSRSTPRFTHWVTRKYFFEIRQRAAQSFCRFTFGSQPSRRLALRMSGQRRLGSSCGSGLNTICGACSKCLRTRSANSRIVISCGLPIFTGKCSSTQHQPVNALDQIVNIAKTPGLLSVTIHRHRLYL